MPHKTSQSIRARAIPPLRVLMHVLVLACALTFPSPSHAPAQEVPPTGLVRCNATDNGRPAAADLLTDSDRRGDCARGLRLSEGEHRLRVSLRDCDDNATRVRWVRVRAHQTTELEVAFETGELLLLARSNGKPVKATGRAFRRGEVRADLRGDVPARVEAGIYVVDADARGATHRFEAVHVAPAERTVLGWQLPTQTAHEARHLSPEAHAQGSW